VFHPKGGIIRYEIERYMRERLLASGYEVVNTPHITKGDLFMTSGHLQWYADGMFPRWCSTRSWMPTARQPRGPGVLPEAHELPDPQPDLPLARRSYRELPLRRSSVGVPLREERHPVGPHARARMTQDDTHIYDGRPGEGRAHPLLDFVLQTARLRPERLLPRAVDEGGRNPKFIGADVLEEATETLREVAEASGLELVPDPGGAAFYGPKISVQARDAIGRTWQMSTIQLDFNQPERFELEYTGPDGEKHRPVMIHRALFGSVERFFAILLEHYAGAFPVWLAPVQVVGIPVADDFAPYLDEIVARAAPAGVRAEVDHSDDRMPKKIRTHTTQKVPLQLIAGEQDRSAGTVSFRFRDGSQTNGIPVDEAIDKIVAAISGKLLVNTAEDLA
jgi:threonyl-tRNA synthetase